MSCFQGVVFHQGVKGSEKKGSPKAEGWIYGRKSGEGRGNRSNTFLMNGINMDQLNLPKSVPSFLVSVLITT